MKILNTIFLICAFSTVSFAQMSIDLGVSHANLKGDFHSNINNPLLGKKGIYFGVNKPLFKSSSLNFSFNYNNYSSNINQVNNVEELQLRYNTNVVAGGIAINISPFQQNSFQPYASIGASVMHYNPKADLKNEFGSYMFINGILTSTNGEPASLDNVFETSHSEINNFTYSKVALGIPIGIGLKLKMSDFVSLNTLISYNFNFTDNIDNISSNNPSELVEFNSNNDNSIIAVIGFTFIPSNFKIYRNRKIVDGIVYDENNESLIISKSDISNNITGLEEITKHNKDVKIINDSNIVYIDDESYYDGVDFDALDKELTSDLDGDGVPDIDDMCPNTPKKPNNSQKLENILFGEVKVDERGCPIDSDNDGVPDYRDIEPNTKSGFLVNHEGKRLSTKEAEKLLTKLDVVSREYANSYNKRSTFNLNFEENYYPYITPLVYDEILKMQQELLIYQVADNSISKVNSIELLSMKRDSTINYLEKIKALEIEYLRITSELKALKNVLSQSKKDVSFIEIEELDFKPIDESDKDVDHYQVYVHRIIQLIKLQNNIKRDLDE